MFLNEKSWYRQAPSYTDRIATKQAWGEWGRKALGAINKLVMRTQSRMVMRGEIICWVRKDRDGERNRRRRKTPSLA